MSDDSLHDRVLDDMIQAQVMATSRASRAEDILPKIADPVVREQVGDAWNRDKFNREINTITGSFFPASTPMPSDDPAQFLKNTPHTSTPTVFKQNCYICRDPEFAQMGLSLCYPCLACGGHVSADDTVCDVCRADQQELYEAQAVGEGHP